MKNFWVHKIQGYLQLKVEGYGAERFINGCARNGIVLWNVKRLGKKSLICFINTNDVFKIRPLARQADCKVKITKRLGAPFLLRKRKKRSGLMAGAFAFIFLMFLFSNVIWNIQVKGASPEINHQLRTVLQEMGIKRGKFHFLMPPPEKIQQALMENIDGVTWIGVNLNGTTYHFQVVEKTIPKEKENYGPRHLVATKKATIYDYFVEEGNIVVEINQTVQKGQTLITGILGKEENTTVVSANGEVYGLVWYKSEVTLPLNSTFTVLTGEEKNKLGLNIKGFTIPIWGFGDGDFKDYDTFTETRDFHFLKWKLPVSYVKTSIKETEKSKRKYTEEEAVNIALQKAKDDIMKNLPKDSVIKSEKILRQVNDNGKVKVTFHITVIEEITKGQPIIQGE
jgi:similar to stage IV sporulation protein